MNTNQLISGQKYIFILNPVDSAVVGILPIEEVVYYLSSVTRKNQQYLRVQRDDQSTYLLSTLEIKEIKE